MGSHVRIAAIDLRLVEAAFDDRRFGVVRNHKMRRAADRLKRPGMGADKVGKRLRPDGFRVRVSRPTEFHPQPLLEPDVILSDHPAPIIQP